MELTDFEKGYLIGLAVGEGCFSGSKGQFPIFTISAKYDDPEPVHMFQQVFGGDIYRYKRTAKDGRTRDVLTYLLRGTELKRHICFFATYLTPSKKRVQFEKWLDTYNLRQFVNGYDGEVIKRNRTYRQTSKCRILNTHGG